MKPQLSALTIIGNDRPGIIAKVTEVLFRRHCNLEDISMTILENQFAMMMVVCLNPKNRAQIESDFKKIEKSWQLSFFWKDLKNPNTKQKALGAQPVTYLITAIGLDRTGIVYKVSHVLAANGLNIRDLNSKILGKGSKALYAMALETDIPAKFPLKKLRRTFAGLCKKLSIEIQIKPVERIEF